MGERLTGSQEVSGSIPLISTIKSLENTKFSRLFSLPQTHFSGGIHERFVDCALGCAMLKK